MGILKSLRSLHIFCNLGVHGSGGNANDRMKMQLHGGDSDSVGIGLVQCWLVICNVTMATWQQRSFKIMLIL